MARQGFEPEVRPRPEAEPRSCFTTAPSRRSRSPTAAPFAALHLGIAQGLTEDTGASVTELVAYDPRKADCRLRIRVDPADAPEDTGTLSLRGKAGMR